MRPSDIIGTDIDGVISDSPLHFGARSRFLRGLWRASDRVGLSQPIMSRAHPRPWVVEWLQAMSRAGHPIWVITHRGCKHYEFTEKQLRGWGVPFSHLFTFPGGDPVAFKANIARFCTIVLEDQQELIDGMQATLGGQAPVFYNTTRDADRMQAMLENNQEEPDHVETV